MRILSSLTGYGEAPLSRIVSPAASITSASVESLICRYLPA
jgi:hypothetical protein